MYDDEEIDQDEQDDLLASDNQPEDYADEEMKTFTDEEILEAEYRQLEQEQQGKTRRKDLKRKIKHLRHPTVYKTAERIKTSATEGGSRLAGAGKSILSSFKNYALGSGDPQDRAERKSRIINNSRFVTQQTGDVIGQSKRSDEILFGNPLYGNGEHGTRPDHFLGSGGQGNNNSPLLIGSGGSGGQGSLMIGGSGGLSLGNETSGRNDLLSIGGGSRKGSGLSIGGSGSGGISLFGPAPKTRIRSRTRRSKRGRRSKSKRRQPVQQQRTGLSLF